MNEPQNRFSTGPRCPQCGAELPGGLPTELCPKCLLKTGLATQAQSGLAGTTEVSPQRLSSGLPQPGEQLGHYRIVRALGGGGMGSVFEAEDTETGRRVALKTLSQALDSPDARERFFREGRLAASVNHPNSVYVFGTEEIAGTPVITMELVAGGTLEDRVCTRGPMRPAEAVDAVLQIIAGLEAAQRIGIIHRDIKPSNCFVDADGTVKIGDFGLSISTAVRAETGLTLTGGFLGTPAFCSPEQLRGEELNARSDMYSVGATLFHLLTGHAPFQSGNVVSLIATVLEKPAPSAGQFQPRLPRGLCNAVRRCLEKQPGERFRSYEELRKSLAPFSSSAPAPATLGLRFLAGLVDINLLALLGLAIAVVAAGLRTRTPPSFFNFMDLLHEAGRQSMAVSLGVWVVWVLYFVLPEGSWGATPGKLLCRLRVVGPDNHPPGFWRAFIRVVIYLLATSVVEILVFGVNPLAYLSVATNSTWLQNLLAASDFILLAMLFTTMRHGNGFAAVHDLVTKTRVVSRTALLVRPATTTGDASPPNVEAKPLVGPYHILDTIEESSGTSWLLGYDLRLLRKVWIRTVPAGCAPVPARSRNLGRVGRLRWLAGRRSPEENWDAFEAVDGQPFLQLLRQSRQDTTGKVMGPVSNPQPWSQVRFWLCDLATELSAAQKEGTLPPLLALDRVWITGDGRAKLLDFPAPGYSGPPAEATSPPLLHGEDAPGFLGQLATVALEGRADAAAKLPGEVTVPLPLHARQFLKRLLQPAGVDDYLSAVRPLLQRVAVVTRRRRAAMVAGCVAFPLAMALATVCMAPIIRRWNHQNQGVVELMRVLELRSGLKGADKDQFPVPTDRQFAIYIAGHYRAAVTNNDFVSGTLAHVLIKNEDRRFANDSITQYPEPTGGELTEAGAALLVASSIGGYSFDDIRNLSGFTDQLGRRSDPVSAFLWQSLSDQD